MPYTPFMKPALLLLALLLMPLTRSTFAAQSAEEELTVFAQSTQLIVVTTPDWSTLQGHLQRYERANPHAEWQPVGDSIPVVVGKNGMAWGRGLIRTDNPEIRTASDPVKKEGDGKSPAGVFALGRAFGYDSQPLPGLKMQYLALTPSIECVDDSHSKLYNRVVDHNKVTSDWNSSEHMRDTGESYRWGAIVGHNGILAEGEDTPPIPYGGSCIFLHVWQNATSGTAGCTAMEPVLLKTMLVWLDPMHKPLLVQLPTAQYAQLLQRWNLPKVANIAR